MSQTNDLLGAVIKRLAEAFGKELAVELFPEQPDKYRLNHPRGAVLVAYGRSRFGGSEATDAVFQARDLVIPLTLVFRQLNGRDGVIEYLDRVRLELTGWTAPHCDQPLRPQEEQFIGQIQGLWQYALHLATRTTQLQQYSPPGGPPMVLATFEDVDP